jgi:hypothetical protein
MLGAVLILKQTADPQVGARAGALRLDAKGESARYVRRGTREMMAVSRGAALLQEGVPDSIRARVWNVLIDGSKKESYRKYLLMPDNKAVEQIKLDLHRTLTSHRLFEGECRVPLDCVLCSPDPRQRKWGKASKSYCASSKRIHTTIPTLAIVRWVRCILCPVAHLLAQGMSFLAAILLTILPEDDAFAGLCQVISGMEGYFVPTMYVSPLCITLSLSLLHS